MKRITTRIILALILISSINTFAQDESESTSKSNIDLGLDVQSRYIWRGLQFGGESASAQPWIEFASGGFTIGSWGAYSLGGINGVQEADFYIGYAFSDAISITVTDYFFPGAGAKYFPYNEGHVIEGMISVSGGKSFPVDLNVATNFGGAIKYYEGTDEKTAYSTYVELSHETEIAGTPFSIAVGGVFGDDNGYYLTDGSGLINVTVGTSKDIKLSESFSLPVNAAITLNPDSEDIFFTFGFSL